MHQDLAAGASSCSRGLLAGHPRRHSTTVFAARLTQPGGGCTLGQWASPVGVNRTTLRPVVDVEFLLPVHFPIHEPLTGNPTSELRGTRLRRQSLRCHALRRTPRDIRTTGCRYGKSRDPRGALQSMPTCGMRHIRPRIVFAVLAARGRGGAGKRAPHRPRWSGPTTHTFTGTVAN